MIKHKGKCECNTAFANPNIKFTALDCPVHNPAPDICPDCGKKVKDNKWVYHYKYKCNPAPDKEAEKIKQEVGEKCECQTMNGKYFITCPKCKFVGIVNNTNNKKSPSPKEKIKCTCNYTTELNGTDRQGVMCTDHIKKLFSQKEQEAYERGQRHEITRTQAYEKGKEDKGKEILAEWNKHFFANIKPEATCYRFNEFIKNLLKNK